MVADNKLCAIYLIFHLDLNYKMGSQRQWTVFELLDLLSAVNMQLYVCRKKLELFRVCLEILYIKFVFYPFQVHNSKLKHMLQSIKTGCKIKCLSLVAILGHMQEMRMNVKHLDTIAQPLTLRYMILKF